MIVRLSFDLKIYNVGYSIVIGQRIFRSTRFLAKSTEINVPYRTRSDNSVGALPMHFAAGDFVSDLYVYSISGNLYVWSASNFITALFLFARMKCVEREIFLWNQIVMTGVGLRSRFCFYFTLNSLLLDMLLMRLIIALS